MIKRARFGSFWMLLVLIPSAGLTASPKADGLSWTDPNVDTLCDMPPCSTATISQLGPDVIGSLKVYTIHTLLILYPKDGTGSVNIRVVLETADHVKRTFSREHLPIKVHQETRLRYCEADFMSDAGVISMLSIDANEIDKKGDLLSRHAFR
jgi:hypothetical protein